MRALKCLRNIEIIRKKHEMAVAKQQSEAWRKALDGVPDSLRMLLEINNIEKNLAEILPRLNNLFDDDCFSILLEELKNYDRDVEKHYNEYTRTNKIWNKLKEELQGE